MKIPLASHFARSLLGHSGEQAQIVAFGGEAATPRLEVADGAMPVQDERWWLPIAAGCPDRVDDLARPGDMVPDLHRFCGGNHRRRSVFQCLPVSRWPATARAHRNTRGGCRKVWLVPGENRTGTKVRDALTIRLAVFWSVRRRRKVIDGRVAVDIMRGGLIVEAALSCPKSRSSVTSAPMHSSCCASCFVHRRNACLDIGEEAAWCRALRLPGDALSSGI